LEDFFWEYRADGRVASVGVSADGSYTVAGTDARSVFLFDGDGSLLWTYKFGAAVKCVAISGDGSRIVVGIHEFYSGRPDFYLFDIFGNIIWQKDLVEGSWPCDVSISPDAKYIVTGDTEDVAYFYDIDGNSVWNYTTGNWVSAVSTSVGGEYTAVGSQDESLYFFDKAGNLLWSYKFEFSVEAVSVSPEGEYVAAGTPIEQDLFLFDKNGTILSKTQFELGVEAVSVSANAERIAVGWGYRDKIVLIDRMANITCELQSESAPVDVAITADGKFVVFCCSDCVYFLEPLPPSEIACNVMPSLIFLGESVTVNGSVTPPTANAKVTLEYKLMQQDSIYMPDGFIKVTRTMMTLANGSFIDTFTPNGTGSWKITASWNGDAEHSPSGTEAFFNVDQAVKTSLLSATPVTLYWSRERWYCTECFPSTPQMYERHYFLNSTTPTSNSSTQTGFNPHSFVWLGHPEWGYCGAHTGFLYEDTLIEKGLWNLSIWASADEAEQHFGVQLCYWDENDDSNFIAFWDTGNLNSTKSNIIVQLTHSFDLAAVMIPKGSRLGFRIFVGPDSNVNLFFDSTLHPSYVGIPPSTEVVTYELAITATSGGTTTPSPRTHTYVSDTNATVTATPAAGYSFDHWELDGTNIGSANSVNILMYRNHTLLAVFVDNIPPVIEKPLQDPTTSILPYQNVTVTAKVTDLGSKLHNVTLWHSVDNETTWAPLEMLPIGANIYQTTIPSYENSTRVRYKITATDNAGNPSVNDNAGYYYIYQVIPEFPTITSMFMLLFFAAIILLTKNYACKREKQT